MIDFRILTLPLSPESVPKVVGAWVPMGMGSHWFLVAAVVHPAFRRAAKMNLVIYCRVVACYAWAIKSNIMFFWIFLSSVVECFASHHAVPECRVSGSIRRFSRNILRETDSTVAFCFSY